VEIVLEIVLFNLMEVDPRVDPCADDNFAIRLAIERGYKEIEEMLRQGMCCDSIGDSIWIVLEILSQHCSRLLQEPATVLR
jgi:hypothetical protein